MFFVNMKILDKITSVKFDRISEDTWLCTNDEVQFYTINSASNRLTQTNGGNPREKYWGAM